MSPSGAQSFTGTVGKHGCTWCSGWLQDCPQGWLLGFGWSPGTKAQHRLPWKTTWRAWRIRSLRSLKPWVHLTGDAFRQFVSLSVEPWTCFSSVSVCVHVYTTARWDEEGWRSNSGFYFHPICFPKAFLGREGEAGMQLQRGLSYCWMCQLSVGAPAPVGPWPGGCLQTAPAQHLKRWGEVPGGPKGWPSAHFLTQSCSFPVPGIVLLRPDPHPLWIYSLKRKINI